MKAIILAAGQGKRLRLHTDNVPKCMVKLFGKSLLEWQINTLRRCNILDISVVTGYCSNVIDFPDITYFKNEKFDSTNMVETLFCAKEKLDGSVIISYGDIIYEKKILQKLIDSTHEISVVVDENWEKYWKLRFLNPLEDAESLKIDTNGFINDIGQEVKTLNEIQGQYIGLMKFQNNGLKELINFYEDSKLKALEGKNPLNTTVPFEKSFMTDLLQGLIKANFKVKTIPISNGWLELDSSQDYQKYTKMYEDNSLSDLISLQNLW